MAHGRTKWGVVAALAIWALAGAWSASGQAFSPGESQIVIPTAEWSPDGQLVIGYGRVPNRLGGQPLPSDTEIEHYHEAYTYTIQFIPRLSLHVRMSFRTQEDGYKGEDRMLGFRASLLKQSKVLPSIAMGVRDVSGTRKRHTSYLVATRRERVGFLEAHVSVGYSKHIFESRGFEMKEGIFYGATISALNRLELMYEMDTTAHYFGVRAWPLKWVWASAFMSSLDETGVSVGIARVLGAE